MALTIKDLQKLQTQLPDYPMELVEGEIIVMSPSGLEADEQCQSYCRAGRWQLRVFGLLNLMNWIN